MATLTFTNYNEGSDISVPAHTVRCENRIYFPGKKSKVELYNGVIRNRSVSPFFRLYMELSIPHIVENELLKESFWKIVSVGLDPNNHLVFDIDKNPDVFDTLYYEGRNVPSIELIPDIDVVGKWEYDIMVVNYSFSFSFESSEIYPEPFVFKQNIYP